MMDDFFTADVLLRYVSLASWDLKDCDVFVSIRRRVYKNLTSNLRCRSTIHCSSSAQFEVSKSSGFPPVKLANSS